MDQRMYLVRATAHKRPCNSFQFTEFVNYSLIITPLTTGGSKEADMATPTRDPAFPPRTERATPAPEGRAIKMPTHKERSWPLFQQFH